MLSLERVVRSFLSGGLWRKSGVDVRVGRKVEDIADWNMLSSVDRDLDRIPWLARHGQHRSEWLKG